MRIRESKTRRQDDDSGCGSNLDEQCGLSELGGEHASEILKKY